MARIAYYPELLKNDLLRRIIHVTDVLSGEDLLAAVAAEGHHWPESDLEYRSDILDVPSSSPAPWLVPRKKISKWEFYTARESSKMVLMTRQRSPANLFGTPGGMVALKLRIRESLRVTDRVFRTLMHMINLLQRFKVLNYDWHESADSSKH